MDSSASGNHLFMSLGHCQGIILGEKCSFSKGNWWGKRATGCLFLSAYVNFLPFLPPTPLQFGPCSAVGEPKRGGTEKHPHQISKTETTNPSAEKHCLIVSIYHKSDHKPHCSALGKMATLGRFVMLDGPWENQWQSHVRETARFGQVWHGLKWCGFVHSSFPRSSSIWKSGNGCNTTKQEG